MKLNPFSVFQPVCFFIFLAIAVLILPSVLIPSWKSAISHVEEELKWNSESFHYQLIAQVEHIASILHPMNKTATALAKVLHSSLSGTSFSFGDIETKAAPSMFQAFLAVPRVVQICYAGLDGIMFSFYIDRHQLMALYANSSFDANRGLAVSKNYTWYKQMVDHDTGNLYGVANVSHPQSFVKSSWFQEGLNSTSGFTSLQNGWYHEQNLLLLYTARINEKGVISVGFPVKEATELFSALDFRGGSLYLAGLDGKIILQGLPDTQMTVSANSSTIQIVASGSRGGAGHIGNSSCDYSNGKSGDLEIYYQNMTYKLYCAPIDIQGKESVYALVIPDEAVIHSHQKSSFLFWLLIAWVAAMFIIVFGFISLIIRASRREMYLCATLIKQMEATQQAERKSMSKSTAFAQASHDIRASLAGVMGLIDVSSEEVSSSSELSKNLKQMKDCAEDLLGLLNSILDTSKIEAGKMLLEEEEFDLAQLLEDVVDLFHALALRNNVDVVLDPYDGSVLKSSLVKGDKGKLKQILCNLLSNAVKFTNEGHISVRAWVKKPSFENSIIASSQHGWRKHLPCLFDKNDEKNNGVDGINAPQRNPNSMEFVFEVDDTGKGIPKEKRASVFENYIQVKETAQEQGGTGLGLGIVQSLVRLMGGDIKIMDKGIGKRGTCFRFNVFLTIADAKAEKILNEDELQGFSAACSLPLTIRTPTQGMNFRSPSLGQVNSPRPGGSHVVLLIQNEERRRTTHSYMERLGIKVSTASEWQDLPIILKKLQMKWNLFNYSSSGKSDTSLRTISLRSASSNSHGKTKDVPPFGSFSGSDEILPVYARTAQKERVGALLIVIDTNSGCLSELYEIINQFRRELPSVCCKVVWLCNPMMRSIDHKAFREGWLEAGDIVISKPFHGTRLFQVLRLLPEFGGSMQKTPSIHIKERAARDEKHTAQETGSTSGANPLRGKKVLIAEDSEVLRELAIRYLLKLGASVEVCVNGKDAVESVSRGFVEQTQRGVLGVRPYDFIFMDCEMPILDGFEATRMIREEEKIYGVRMPIIALTGHSSGITTKKIFETGMDFHLKKPTDMRSLIEAIREIERRISRRSPSKGS